MAEYAKEITPIKIEEEMQQSYLDYAMSVIVSRALPDVRDGLKPVHRRILFAMKELGNDYNKPYKKSARIVGDVIGKYHPHGDLAVYDAIVRMAQPFSMRYPLIDGQGNFGSIDGDAAAAMRYTEIRLERIGHFLLNDLNKNTVDFLPNYDGTEFAPGVLPAAFPCLLVNGSSGIAVGMATNIPPHNLGETIDASIALIDNPEITITELMKIMPGPDFPTAAMITGSAGIEEAYRTGRGKIIIRSKVRIENHENSDRQMIIVDELPYQVNKAALITQIAGLVKDKKISGISAIRDESDKEGIRVVIEVHRGDIAEVVLNTLYRETQLQISFGINMVALVDGQPRTLNLKQILTEFLKHRREVVTRRCIFELKEARSRAHILEGLSVALANIDEVIALIKAAKNPSEAKGELLARVWSSDLVAQMVGDASGKLSRPDNLADEYGMTSTGYRLSEAQAQAILDLKLHRLTGLEQDKLNNEYKELLVTIKGLLDILDSRVLLENLIKEELLEVKRLFNDKRLTQIIPDLGPSTREDFVVKEDVVVTLSHEGYAKIQSLQEYRVQRRGGRGKVATKMKEEDFIKQLFIANTHDTLLCFSNLGRLYWLRVYQIPFGSRGSRGRPLVNLLRLGADERITVVLPIHEFLADHYIFMATAQGVVKRIELASFAKPKVTGVRALVLRGDDQLIGAALTDGQREVILFSSAGKAVRFSEQRLRAFGRMAAGVRGMKLEPGQAVISLAVVYDANDTVLIVNEHGYGKRTPVDDFRLTNRGAAGVVASKLGERNGKIVGALQVKNTDELMLISDRGVLVRIPVASIRVVGRSAQGVRLVNFAEANEHLVSAGRIAIADDEVEIFDTAEQEQSVDTAAESTDIVE